MYMCMGPRSTKETKVLIRLYYFYIASGYVLKCMVNGVCQKCVDCCSHGETIQSILHVIDGSVEIIW